MYEDSVEAFKGVADALAGLADCRRAVNTVNNVARCLFDDWLKFEALFELFIHPRRMVHYLGQLTSFQKLL